MRKLAAAIACCVAAVTAGDARTTQPLPELITPSDTRRFIQPTRAIWASGLQATTRCQIAVQLADDPAIIVLHVISGMVMPLRVVRVMATDTTCPYVAVIPQH